MHYVVPLIAEAWEAHHRRRNRLVIAALASVALAALVYSVSGGPGVWTGGGGQRAGGAVSVRSSVVLSRAPYMGIAVCRRSWGGCSRVPYMGAGVCHPSAGGCYRVGLAVWLKRSAVSVTASIGGVRSSLKLTDRRGIQMTGYVRRREFIGFFHRRGLVPQAYLQTADATPRTPFAVLRLTINDGHGRSVVTSVRVPIEPGWK